MKSNASHIPWTPVMRERERGRDWLFIIQDLYVEWKEGFKYKIVKYE